MECKPVSLWPCSATTIGKTGPYRQLPAAAWTTQMKRNLHKKGLLEADPYLIAILEVIRRSDHNWSDSRDLWQLFGDMEGLAGVGIPTLP
jgi:hypothetical protein